MIKNQLLAIFRGLMPALLLLFVFEATAKEPTIKSVEPADVCVGETVTINGKELKQVTHIVFNEVNLFKSAGDFEIVKDDRIIFTAPGRAVTNGRESVITTIFIGADGFFPADRYENIMSVNPLPGDPKNPTGSEYCEGDPVGPVRVDGPGNNYRIDWYDKQTGGHFLFTGDVFIPEAPGTYFAEVVSISGCVSERVPAETKEISAPPSPSGGRSSTYCEGTPVSPVTVDNPGSGFRINWYDAPTGGSLLGTGMSYTPEGPGTFYAENFNTSTSCSSLSRVKATVTMNAMPPVASNPRGAFYCGSEPVPSISVNNPGKGFTVKWYNQSTGTVRAPGTTSGQNGEIFTPSNGVSATYYAEIENDNTGCSSHLRTAVRVEKNPAGCMDTDFTSYFFDQQEEPPTIDFTNHKISAILKYGTSLKNLIASFTIPEKAVARINGVIQQSGVTVNDFSKPVVYTVTAADGETRQDWDVAVAVAPNSKVEILTFSIPGQTKPASIDRKNRLITVEVLVWTDITRLKADFTLSAGAKAYIGNLLQESGKTINNFSETVTYKIVAQDGSTSTDWRVKVVRQNINDNQDPVIVSANMPDEFPVIMDSISASAVIEDNIGVSHVVLRYKKYQDNRWNQMIVRSRDSLYSCFIKDTLIGNHGMHYYFKVYDYKNNVDSTVIIDMVNRYTNDNSPEFPNLNFGGEVEDYQIISVPLFLDDNSVASVFDELMPYDIKRWRLFSYNGGVTGEFGKSFNQLIPGQGYWLIIRNDTPINVGSGITNRMINGGYALNLAPGWNLIGNPYSFNISWDEVINYNGKKPVSRLKTYDEGMLNESGILPAYGGGFIFSGSAQSIQLVIPPVQETYNARISEPDHIAGSGNLGTPSWFVPISITNGRIKNMLNGIGMDPESKEGFDKLDEPLLPVPREIAGFEMYFLHDDENYSRLARDIAASDDYHEWEFEVVRYGGGTDFSLQWDNEWFNDNDFQLVLFDVSFNRLIDMNTVNNYAFHTTDITRFKIFYGKENILADKIMPSQIQVGEIYPNPFSQKIFIPLGIPDGQEQYEVKLVITDLTGRKLYETPVQRMIAGYHNISFDIGPNQGNAVNIFQIFLTSASNKEVIYRKVLRSR